MGNSLGNLSDALPWPLPQVEELHDMVFYFPGWRETKKKKDKRLGLGDARPVLIGETDSQWFSRALSYEDSQI